MAGEVEMSHETVWKVVKLRKLHQRKIQILHQLLDQNFKCWTEFYIIFAVLMSVRFFDIFDNEYGLNGNIANQLFKNTASKFGRFEVKIN